jgi:uncharacterized membrane protein YjgN (DUF898 family)
MTDATGPVPSPGDNRVIDRGEGSADRPELPLPFTFTGKGGEYFRIWIVNLLLSVATLGVYSAWAKVRRLQYFYRNTRVADASFDYHGDPIAILKGRIIAVCLFAGYSFAGSISPTVGAAAFVALAGIFPFFVVRSLRFRLHNSSYRGLRFRFLGSTRQAYWTFLALPLLTVLSLFTLVPFWFQRVKRFQYANSAYGQTSCVFDAPVSGFYRIYLTAGAWALGMAMALAILLTEAMPAMGAAAVIGAAAYLFGWLGLWAFTTARVQNLVWTHTRLGPHRFGCSLDSRRLLFITVTNLVGTVVTLGLFRPYAQLRVARYMASRFSLLPGGTLDHFIAGEQRAVSAVGEGTLDVFDIDLAF